MMRPGHPAADREPRVNRSVTIVAPPLHGTLSGTAPDVTYTPDTGYFGQDFFTFDSTNEPAIGNTAVVGIVVATTGHTPAQKREIEAAAHHTAVLMAPNMSLAVNVLMKLVRQAGAALKDKDFDVEIIERHHRYKKDSPSGTALHFAKAIQEAMGQTELRHGREGLVGERPPHEIGIHAVRVGDNVGEHAIVFSTLGETMELVHRAHTRDCYARGALQAARFLVGKPAGRYTMNDVLGL